jgi:hypothetical protein
MRNDLINRHDFFCEYDFFCGSGVSREQKRIWQELFTAMKHPDTGH